ncbi:MAG: phage antirepressor N-terminal domain-containing protein [Polyangia bacterium]
MIPAREPASNAPSAELLGVPEGCRLRAVSIEEEGGRRLFLLQEDRTALALDEHLTRWLELSAACYPLRDQIRWYAERGTLGAVQHVWQRAGRSGRPAMALCLSRAQLLLLLDMARIRVPGDALERTLRSYDRAEGREATAPSGASPAAVRQPGTEQGPPASPDGAPSVQLVPFLGGTLSALRTEAQGWLVLKPACEALGIDVTAQRKRLERTPWATAAIMTAVGADGRQREMYCLRSDRVAMWLATIDTARIADPEARQRLELWQCHAADALDRWARGGAPGPSPADEAAAWRRIAEPAPPPAAPRRSHDRDSWLSPQQVAQRTGVGVRRVYRWIRACAIEHRRLGVRDIRIHVDALAEFLASHDTAALPR